MVIDPAIANRFINEYKRFLLAIYEANGKQEEPQRAVDRLASARRRFISNRGLLDDYISTLEDGTEPIDRKMMLAIRSVEFSKWVYLRDLKSCSIFIKADGGSGYGVLGLTDEISVFTQGVGVVLEAGVVALDDHYVCDGLIASLAHLGPNYRRSYNDLYKNLRTSGRFQASPVLSQGVPVKTGSRRSRNK